VHDLVSECVFKIQLAQKRCTKTFAKKFARMFLGFKSQFVFITAPTFLRLVLVV
jgi:hypothetical protein